MITACSHCGKKYKVPDKMLGRHARCRACGESFLIASAEPLIEAPQEQVFTPPAPEPSPNPEPEPEDDVFVPPKASGSTAYSHEPVNDEEAGWDGDEEDDDPLARLADAAADSSAEMPPPHYNPIIESSSPQPADEDHRGHRPKRMAKGAGLAMGMGITSLALAFIGGLLALVAMLSANQDLTVALGLVGLIMVAMGALTSMLAVVNGSSASRAIRRARHPLSGKGQASTGSILGLISIGLVLITIVGGLIWLSTSGGLVFQNQVDEQGNEIVESQADELAEDQPETPPVASADEKRPVFDLNATNDVPSQPSADVEEAAATGAAIGFLVLSCGFLIFGLLVFAFWLWMLIDCCTKTFKGNEKIVWILLIVLLGGLGALIYFFAGRPNAIKPGGRRR